MFMFAFGAPKVREVDVTVGGTRFLEIPESPGIAAARKISPYGYLSDVAPGPIFVGVEKPMKVYTIDNILFTHAKVPDDVVYKMIETMEANKADMIAVAPNLREFSAAQLNKKYDFPYHPGALEILQGQEHRGQGVSVNEKVQPPDAAKPAFAVSRATVVATDVLQAAAADLRRRLGAGYPAARVRAGVLHRAAPGGVHGAGARALLHRRGRAAAVALRLGRRHRLVRHCRLPRLSSCHVGSAPAVADRVPGRDPGMDRRRQQGLGDALVRLDRRRAVAGHLPLHHRPLRAADLRDRAVAARRHHRQRDPRSARARGDAPHRRCSAGRHHPDPDRLRLHRSRIFPATSPPARSRPSGCSSISVSTSMA